MDFHPGFDITPLNQPLGFIYGTDVFGPVPELRYLEDIRESLAIKDSDGPPELYSIAMDIGRQEDKRDIMMRNLLFGAVTYAAGTIGEEPVRSQGHIHSVSASCSYSTPEVYEIWDGEAVIYMQESKQDNPGNCYAVYAKAGEVVIVPPGWVHATINADVTRNMTFGAWCVRDYGYDYESVRKHNGIAYFPFVTKGSNEIKWTANTAYSGGTLIEKKPRTYRDFGIESGIPIYEQFRMDREGFRFVVKPMEYLHLFEDYKP